MDQVNDAIASHVEDPYSFVRRTIDLDEFNLSEFFECARNKCLKSEIEMYVDIKYTLFEITKKGAYFYIKKQIKEDLAKSIDIIIFEDRNPKEHSRDLRLHRKIFRQVEIKSFHSFNIGDKFKVFAIKRVRAKERDYNVISTDKGVFRSDHASRKIIPGICRYLTRGKNLRNSFWYFGFPPKLLYTLELVSFEYGSPQMVLVLDERTFK